MEFVRRAVLSLVAVCMAALPAAAQMTTAAPDTAGGSGGSLLFVWGWILVAGVIIFIVGTSMGVGSNRK